MRKYQRNERRKELCGDRQALNQGQCLVGHAKSRFSFPIAFIPQVLSYVQESSVTLNLSLTEEQRVTDTGEEDLNYKSAGALGGKFVYLLLLETQSCNNCFSISHEGTVSSLNKKHFPKLYLWTLLTAFTQLSSRMLHYCSTHCKTARGVSLSPYFLTCCMLQYEAFRVLESPKQHECCGLSSGKKKV